MSKPPRLFISYRRADSRPWANLIYAHLRNALGADAVFMDVDKLRAGDDWPRRIEEALDRATVVMPLIGQQWLFLQDARGRRRLDLPDDWVRREITAAQEGGRVLLPVWVDGADPLEPDDLPDGLKHLARHQGFPLNDVRGLPGLLKELTERHGFKAINDDLDFPVPVDLSAALPEDELQGWLDSHGAWRRVEREHERGTDGVIQELVRVFKFRSFSDAMHFMTTATRYIDRTEHHPRWENQYQDVRVVLSSWDTGHRVTFKDTRLAEYLESVYRDYGVGL